MATYTDWQDKKVLVTGASGFIGSHLVEALVQAGARVRALVRYNSRNDWGLLELLPPEVKSRLEVVVGDLTDPYGTFRLVAGCGTIFHLAALIAIPYSYTAPAQFVAVNCGGTLNLLEAARWQGIDCFVHTSTSETYGTAQYIPIDENHPLTAQSPYAASKIAADKLAESYYLSFNLPVVTVRPFNTFGPRQSARAIIPTIIAQALTGEVIRLGNLEPRRDLTFVTDIVDGFLKAGALPEAIGQVINLGTGHCLSMGELAQTIVRLLKQNKKILSVAERFRPEKSEVWHLECNNRRARELLKWQPQVTLEEGLERTLAFIAAHPERYKPEIYNV